MYFWALCDTKTTARYHVKDWFSVNPLLELLSLPTVLGVPTVAHSTAAPPAELNGDGEQLHTGEKVQ